MPMLMFCLCSSLPAQMELDCVEMLCQSPGERVSSCDVAGLPHLPVPGLHAGWRVLFFPRLHVVAFFSQDFNTQQPEDMLPVRPTLRPTPQFGHDLAA